MCLGLMCAFPAPADRELVWIGVITGNLLAVPSESPSRKGLGDAELIEPTESGKIVSCYEQLRITLTGKPSRSSKG